MSRTKDKSRTALRVARDYLMRDEKRTGRISFWNTIITNRTLGENFSQIGLFSPELWFRVVVEKFRRNSSLVPRPSSLLPRPSSLTEFCPHRSGKTTEPIWLKFGTSILWQKLARRAKYEMYI